MNILCLGRGLVGLEFQRAGITTLGREVLSIDTHFTLRDAINTNPLLSVEIDNADVIINCIAFTNTKPKTIAEFQSNINTNILFVSDLIELCGLKNKKLVHISTGDVYGDSQRLRRSKAYKETDSTILMTEYSAAKHLAEQFIDSSKHIVLRPRLVFGVDNIPSNLFTKLVKYNTFTPYMNSFCSAKTIVEAALVLIEKNLTGTFNVCNSGVTSMIDLAELIRNQFDPSKIITPAEIDSINNVLDHQKLSKYYTPRYIIDEFADVFGKYLQTNPV